MKSLSHYTRDATSALIEKHGVIFAFSKQQFDDAKSDTNYHSLGGGMLSPVDSSKAFTEELAVIRADGIKQDIAENGLKAIIRRELANFECQITMCIDDAVAALEEYDITHDDVKSEWSSFFQECIDKDYF